VTEEGGLKVIAAVDYSFWQMFLGDRPGAVGTVSSLGAVLGAMFLIWTGMASWRVMLGSLIGLAGMTLILNSIAPDNELFAVPWQWQMVLGGYLFGLVFLATDPVAGRAPLVVTYASSTTYKRGKSITEGQCKF